MTFFLMALCGGLGAVVRFLVDSAINKRNRLSVPLGTVVVNVTACFLLGLLTGLVSDLAAQNPALSASLATILGTGFLGGYSTFSTASVEGFREFERGRVWRGVAHAGGMLVLCLMAGALGLLLG